MRAPVFGPQIYKIFYFFIYVDRFYITLLILCLQFYIHAFAKIWISYFIDRTKASAGCGFPPWLFSASQCTAQQPAASSHAQVAKLPNAIIKVRKCHHNLPQLLALAPLPALAAAVGETWAAAHKLLTCLNSTSHPPPGEGGTCFTLIQWAVVNFRRSPTRQASF